MAQGKEIGAIEQESSEEKPEELEGQFFDDFDQAFGSDNDVPILDMKKVEEKPKETPAPGQEKSNTAQA